MLSVICAMRNANIRRSAIYVHYQDAYRMIKFAAIMEFVGIMVVLGNANVMEQQENFVIFVTKA